jgi:hypothetical protein
MSEPQKREPGLFQFHFSTALVAMIVVSACGGVMLLATKVDSLTTGDWVAFAIIMILMLMGLLVFLEPFME